MLPDRMLAMKNDAFKAEGFKLAKDRTTLLFCCNKTGNHKLQPLCIEKYKPPRCFHDVSMPFAFTPSCNAWMSAAIFNEWFHESFMPSVRRHLHECRLEEKAVLLLDNCRAHPPADILCSPDGKITVMYFLPNTTSVIQPLDQGIISSFKRHYRKELVKEIILSDTDITPFLKKFSLKDIFLVAGRARESVTSTNIENCWMEGLDPVFPDASSDLSGDDVTSAESDFLGFSEDNLETAEHRLREQLDMDQSLENFITEWTMIDE